jgi:hypothetical protein
MEAKARWRFSMNDDGNGQRNFVLNAETGLGNSQQQRNREHCDNCFRSNSGAFSNQCN